jgi:hypothetical protein
MGEGAWCLIIDNAQGNWIFDITPQGITLHEGPEGQWKPTAVNDLQLRAERWKKDFCLRQTLT